MMVVISPDIFLCFITMLSNKNLSEDLLCSDINDILRNFVI